MRYQRLLISETAIDAMKVYIKKLEIDIEIFGRDYAPDTIHLQKTLEGLRKVVKQWKLQQ